MADSDDKQPKPEPQEESRSQDQAKVAEREPLSVVVLDTPVAEPEARAQTRIEVPVRTEQTLEEPVERRKVPYWYWALVGLGVVLMMISFRRFYSPLLVHVEDSIERRVLGDKIQVAPQSNPHTPRQKQPSWF